MKRGTRGGLPRCSCHPVVALSPLSAPSCPCLFCSSGPFLPACSRVLKADPAAAMAIQLRLRPRLPTAPRPGRRPVRKLGSRAPPTAALSRRRRIKEEVVGVMHKSWQKGWYYDRSAAAAPPSPPPPLRDPPPLEGASAKRRCGRSDGHYFPCPLCGRGRCGACAKAAGATSVRGRFHSEQTRRAQLAVPPGPRPAHGNSPDRS